MRRHPLRPPALLLVFLALAAQAIAVPDSAPARAAAPSEKHSLVLYLVDGLAATEIPAFGYSLPTVPNLSLMMDEGVAYTSAYSVSPWTVPSVASILTSLYPSAHGVLKAGDRLPASAKTLAEVLQANGYETALFSAHPLIGPLSGLDQGFDHVEEVQGPFGPAPVRGPAETSATLNARVLAWLDARKTQGPCFVLVVSEDLQEPFGAPDPDGSYFTQPRELAWYRDVRKKLLALRPGPLSLATSGDLQRLQVDSNRFARAARAVYDGAARYNDRQMGALRDALEVRGLWKKALFVATSTHGEEFGEHGAFGHGASLYDPALRVPLVMSYPPVIPSPRQMRRTCDSVDLLPTLLSMLELPIPEGVQGIERNVEPTFETRLLYERPAFAETSPAGALPTGRAAMINEKGGKLIVYEVVPPGLTRPEMELFRGNDPAGWEKRSLVASAPAVAAHKREILTGWRETKGKLQLAPDPQPATPSPRLTETLRSLGYLQGMEPVKAASPAPKTAAESRPAGKP